MGEPLAYFLTWTTYGTWLHGDPRGSVDRANAAYGMEYNPPDPSRRQRACQRMDEPAALLSIADRDLTERSIREHAAFRGWAIRAISCRSNHVHVVISASGTTPERAMTELKAYATRALRRAGRAGDRRTWTKHGSTKYLWNEASLRAAIQYVESQ